ncbi:hypothetical protein [Chloracidobacterium aggregatum]|jgi:hypothetical protein|uniref:Uncharacterized protein n=1 Tax=Chloracidobacterium sp. N TaxID=2821540 RepID=A0ABX8B2L2_9BACT|nr:hypothetical protein [Chloracidobacterium aggregatum]QUV84826.1 hypothetical protein J8C03_00605 [Chloracidobacterium sp. 2]QUV88773.1 hypothetical protein J8C07_05550 [Chloracidobacterium sp. S]QUV91690.1 hypothetical protein J8C04_04680 [Chloracidobacterium sp. A]QUV94865.1 hypothetical protein J8C05_05360 [Chloracidobacterium sp. N]QUV95977.1 hypothetical protein J8C00_06460 [Chloracidobacterium sp. E]
MGQYVREPYEGYLGGAFHNYAESFGDLISSLVEALGALLKTLAEGAIALISTLMQPQPAAGPSA